MSRNAARDAEIRRLSADGLAPVEIRKRLGISKNIVIGVLWRSIARKPLAQLAETRNPFPPPGHCLWSEPASNPRSPEFSFCGEPAMEIGGSWCALHRKRVFTRVNLDRMDAARQPPRKDPLWLVEPLA